MQEETYNRLLDERVGEIPKISKEIDFNNLTYCFKGPGIAPINFLKFRGLLHISKEIKNDNILLQKAEVEQKQFESEIGEIKEGIQRQVRISVRYKRKY